MDRRELIRLDVQHLSIKKALTPLRRRFKSRAWRGSAILIYLLTYTFTKNNEITLDPVELGNAWQMRPIREAEFAEKLETRLIMPKNKAKQRSSAQALD